jgi:hypothetical protein
MRGADLMTTLAFGLRVSPNPWEKNAGTQTDWPVLMSAVLWSDPAGEAARPTRTEVFTITTSDASDDRPEAIVRRAVRRALDDFGPAFDRLGSE